MSVWVVFVGFDELAHKTFLCSVAITEIAIEK